MKKQEQRILEPELRVEELSRSDAHPRVGIFGGSFNPPHLGHLIMAESVRDQLNLDEIQFLPAGIPPHAEGKDVIDSKYRIEMVNLAIEDHPAFTINLTDTSRSGKSYTYDTLRALKEANPNTEYFFIIGGDSVAKLSTWYKIDELMQLVQMIAVRREGYDEASNYPLIWVDAPKIGISSTSIRENVAHGSSIRYLTPDRVIDYIEEEGLYLDE